MRNTRKGARRAPVVISPDMLVQAIVNDLLELGGRRILRWAKPAITPTEQSATTRTQTQLS